LDLTSKILEDRGVLKARRKHDFTWQKGGDLHADQRSGIPFHPLDTQNAHDQEQA